MWPAALPPGPERRLARSTPVPVTEATDSGYAMGMRETTTTSGSEAVLSRLTAIEERLTRIEELLGAPERD